MKLKKIKYIPKITVTLNHAEVLWLYDAVGAVENHVRLNSGQQGAIRTEILNELAEIIRNL